jgi:hypothetical protein
VLLHKNEKNKKVDYYVVRRIIMERKTKIFIVILIALIGILVYSVYENIIESKIARLNVTKSKIVMRNGYEEIDTRYLTVGGEKYIIYREFKNPAKAMKTFKKRHPNIVKKIRRTWIAFGDLSWWNWKLYEKGAIECDQLTHEERNEIEGFFDIYENTEKNKKRLRNFV